MAKHTRAHGARAPRAGRAHARSCSSSRRTAHRHATHKPGRSRTRHSAAAREGEGEGDEGDEAEEAACEAGVGCSAGAAGSFDSSSCEAGATATQGVDGSFSCADGSEPSCPEGNSLSLAGDGTVLVCEIGATPVEPPPAS